MIRSATVSGAAIEERIDSPATVAEPAKRGSTRASSLTRPSPLSKTWPTMLRLKNESVSDIAFLLGEEERRAVDIQDLQEEVDDPGQDRVDRLRRGEDLGNRQEDLQLRL